MLRILIYFNSVFLVVLSMTSQILASCETEGAQKNETPRFGHAIAPFHKKCTLPETNIAPENGWLEY